MIGVVQQPEKWYTTEFFKDNFTEHHVQKRAAFGPSQVPIVNKSLGVITRWADAIVFEPNLITIIEFKLEPKPDAIGQLNLYAQEFYKTPAYMQYWDKPVHKLLVTTRVDDAVQEQAVAHDIEYRVFRPKGIVFWERKRFRLE